MNRTAVWGPSAKIGRQAALSQAKTQKLLRVRDAERPHFVRTVQVEGEHQSSHSRAPCWSGL